MAPPRRQNSPDTAPKLSKQQARSLSYQAPETPSFLRALKAQVAGSTNAKRSRGNDEFDELLAGGGGDRLDANDINDDDDDDDDLAGAQIVVLKEGKHLTKEEMHAVRIQQRKQPADSQPASESIAQAGSAPSQRRKRPVDGLAADDDDDGQRATTSIMHDALEKPDNKRVKSSSGTNLEDVKQLLREEREKKERVKQAAEERKYKKKQEKNKAARAEKKKSGKGLSFSFDDE